MDTLVMNRFTQIFRRAYIEKKAARDFLRGRKRSSNSEYNRTYEEINQLWDELEYYKNIDFPVRQEARRSWKTETKHSSWYAVYVRVSLATLAIIVVSSVWYFDPWPGYERHYMTVPGDRKEIGLADGSSIYLNTGTSVDVRFYRSRREVTLNNGEAFFEIARDHDRPFKVFVANGSVRAIGTAFNIRKNTSSVKVAVTEGEVLVKTQGFKAVSLKHGNMLIFDNEGISDSQQIETESLAQWRNGRVIFNNDSLEKVIKELKRYGLNRSVELQDGTSSMRLSGSFRINEPISVIRDLPLALPVKINENTESIHIENALN